MGGKEIGWLELFDRCLREGTGMLLTGCVGVGSRVVFRYQSVCCITKNR